MRKASFLTLHFICVLSFQAKTADSSQEISVDSSHLTENNSFEQPPTYNFANFTKQGRLTPMVSTAPPAAQATEDSFEEPQTFILTHFTKQGRLTPVAQVSPMQTDTEKISPSKAALAAAAAGSEIASSTAISPLSAASSPGADEAMASQRSAFVTPPKKKRSTPPSTNQTAELTDSFSSTILDLSEIKLSPLDSPPQPEPQLNTTKKTSPSAKDQSVSFISSPGKTPDRSSIFADLSASMITDHPDEVDGSAAFPLDQSSIQTLFSEGSLEEIESDEEPDEEVRLPSPGRDQEILDTETEDNGSPRLLSFSPPQIAQTPLSSPRKEKVTTILQVAAATEEQPHEATIDPAISIEELQEDAPAADISVVSLCAPEDCTVVEKYIEAQEAPPLNISIRATQGAPLPPAIEEGKIVDLHTPTPAISSPQAGIASTIAAGTGAAGLFALALYKHLLIKALEGKAVLSDNEMRHLHALKRWRLGASAGSACMIALAAYLYRTH